MIIELMINTILGFLAIFLNLVMAPVKLIFPVFSTGDALNGVASRIINIISSVDDLFIYFSSSEAWRFLIFCCFLSFIILPFLSIIIGVVKFLISIIRG